MGASLAAISPKLMVGISSVDTVVPPMNPGAHLPMATMPSA